MKADALDLTSLARALVSSPALAAKAAIATTANVLGLGASSSIAVGDDCAAIPDGDRYTLLAIEGFMNEFVAHDPWFAGWCGVMVNVSDVAAMGGRPIAVVDALWALGREDAGAILEGMRAASERFGVPIVGGHTNLNTGRSQLSVAILGQAKKLLTSFDARPGDHLVLAVDLRGAYREPFNNWDAATKADAHKLRGDLELLPFIAETGLARAAKDISQGGVIGTAAMLAECSGVAIEIDVTRVPKPEGVALERWLLTFPSFGYLIAAPKKSIEIILALFSGRGIAVADIGAIEKGHAISITGGLRKQLIRDLAVDPLLGMRPAEAAVA
jgi:uncharacterized protein